MAKIDRTTHRRPRTAIVTGHGTENADALANLLELMGWHVTRAARVDADAAPVMSLLCVSDLHQLSDSDDFPPIVLIVETGNTVSADSDVRIRYVVRRPFDVVEAERFIIALS